MKQRFSRRSVLKASAGLVLAGAGARVASAAPVASAVTPELIAAAKKEGKVVWYTSIDLKAAEEIAKSFEAKYPGISTKVERTGAERVFQRIGQEYSSNVHAVDVVNSSDASHFITWKKNGWLDAYVPEDVAKHYPPEHKDPDGMYASFRLTLSVIGYNTQLVKKEDAPKGLMDLLDPKWAGKMVKSHPGYSGSTMTATFQIVRELGWGYFEKLAKQRVLQVQSATEPPKKLALGERAVQADGSEYVLLSLKESHKPVEPVYAVEGTPLVVGPNGLFKQAPNPNAARLFQSFCFSPQCQQLVVDVGHMRSVHPQVKEKAGRVPLKDIKTMKEDAAGVAKAADEIKRKYTALFHV